MKLTWWHDKPWGQHSQSLHCNISSQRNWFDGLKLWRPEGKSPFNHQYHIFFLNEIRWNESPEDNKMHCAKTWKAPSDISLILEEISILNICPPNNFPGIPYCTWPISHSLFILTMNISVLIHIQQEWVSLEAKVQPCYLSGLGAATSNRMWSDNWTDFHGQG